MKKIVSLDKATGKIEVSVPDEARERQEDLVGALMAEFVYEPITEATVTHMNAFAVHWCGQNGIAVQEEAHGTQN